MLYPLKFKAKLLPKIWGGHTIMKWYDNVPADCDNVGEAWVLSDFGDYHTEVANGSLAGDDLQDLLEVYMDELVGGKIYETFGNQFPLLMKFIDATDDLSIQVHPSDAYAMDHEESRGKTEMWYVLPSGEEASIYLGWNQQMDENIISSAVADGTLANYLIEYSVKGGDVAFIPAGTVHALRRNTIVAEIQENSDLTYRLYDYNRPGVDGKLRPLHIEKALLTVDYKTAKDAVVTHPEPSKAGVVNAVQSPYFTTNVLELHQTVQRDYALLDSFVAYMCVEGQCRVTAIDCESENKAVNMQQGEAVLIPATLNDIRIEPTDHCRLLEIYIELS